MSRTTFSFKNTTIIPHPLPRTRTILLSTSPKDVENVLLKSPIASDFAFVRKEPIYFPPTPTPSISSFPNIQSPTLENPANGLRVHFTYYETVVMFFGLVNTKFPLDGWFAVRDGSDVGVAEIIANPNKERNEQVVVRKVRCLIEAGAETKFEEELGCDVKWGMGWISRRMAYKTHVSYINKFGELFDEA